MNPAYQVLTTNELLREITKHHILQYINFPDMFIDKICIEDTYYLEWLLRDKYVSFDMLNDYVKEITKIATNTILAYGNPMAIYGNPTIPALLDGVNTFLEYILFIKKSPKIVLRLTNKFHNIKQELQIILQNEDNQDYVINYIKDFEQLFDAVNIKLNDYSEDINKMGFPNVCNQNKHKNNHLYKDRNKSMGGFGIGGIDNGGNAVFKYDECVTFCDNPNCGTIIKDFNHFVNYGDRNKIDQNDNPVIPEIEDYEVEICIRKKNNNPNIQIIPDDVNDDDINNNDINDNDDDDNKIFNCYLNMAEDQDEN